MAERVVRHYNLLAAEAAFSVAVCLPKVVPRHWHFRLLVCTPQYLAPVFAACVQCAAEVKEVALLGLLHGSVAEVAADSLVTFVHIDHDGVHHRHLEHEVYPRAVDEAAEEQHEGPPVVREEVGVLHQGQALPAEVFAYVLRDVVHAAISCDKPLSQPLELWCCCFLGVAVVGIVVEEQHANEIPLCLVLIIYSPLTLVRVQLRPLTAQKEEQVYVAIVVSKSRLSGMGYKASQSAQQPNANAPVYVQPWHQLSLQTKAYCNVHTEEPHVGSEAIKHAARQRLLACHACQLTVGRVAEVCRHEKQDTVDVMYKVRMVEHPTCRYAEEEREYRHGVGMDTQTFADERNDHADGPREVDVDVLLRIA